MENVQYIQVVVPLRLGWIPTYSAPADVRPGQRVAVRVSGREYVGVVWRTGVTPDLPAGRILPIDGVEDGLPGIGEREMQLWEFISSYYLCTPGEVYKAAYPMSKVRSEKTAARAVRTASARKEATKEKMAATLRKRIAALGARLAGKDENLRKKHNASVTARLLEERERLASEYDSARRALEELESEASQETADPVPAAPEDVRHGTGKPLLLRGGNRYGEYARMALEALEEGFDVLVLTPDIVFCDRLEAFLRPLFPELEVCNSTRTQISRRKLCDAIRDSSSPHVVLGTRSALFLPFRRLGLIIVDEEQDVFYKQTEPAPRYNGRDVALKLGTIHGAQVVLGSAFPSLESEYNCLRGRFESLHLPQRSFARTVVVDIPAERRKRGMVGDFSRILLREIGEYDGPVTIIRTWEKEDSVREQIASLLPGRAVSVMTMAEARRSGFGDFVAILQADALTDRDDFRSDERAAQTVAQLGSMTRVLVIQTAVASRWDGSRGVADFLAERRQFSFPPFTRLVNVSGPSGLRQHFLKRDGNLAALKGEIAASAARDEIIDVDPV